ncbi:hypothetical protein [Bradyrhizobium arachidis]|jgi:hypothetical protein|uniref:Uncharacterized protein n=1 Tax=Bradyrhizobium arachidis TaxID=858423 RepID=A0AAE7NNG6_9BRAD|nr:hypothetical protein [Bradyrhizobium arachidis]QOZ68637.1 hypothetical protein WN72_21655 [Bradyrhizobium arachidis]SFV06306.1 hypothetical protein SAMN05192541_112116 [Bradyrhizobium arachidis]
MTKSSTASAKTHRYELMHGEDADFVAYQRRREDGKWQTFATWMIPRAPC